MANPPRAIRVRSSAAAIESHYGPALEQYDMPLDVAVPFRWVVGDTSTADDVTVLSHTGGTEGRWIRVRLDVKGDDLTDADATIGVGGNYWRILPASTLTANRTLTLSETNAAAGDVLTITRLDTEAYTLQIDDNASSTTITTLPVSAAWFARFYFDGTNWLLHSAGALP